MGIFAFFKRIVGYSDPPYDEVPSPFHSSDVARKPPAFVIEEDGLEFEDDEVAVTFDNGGRFQQKSDSCEAALDPEAQSGPRAKSMSQRLCEKLSGKHS